MNKLKKVIILGASGYIGKKICDHIHHKYSNIEIIACSPPKYDLLNKRSTKSLNKIITQDSSIIVCSGLKKQRGDNLNNFSKNILMISNLINYVDFSKVNQFVFFSSAEVYGENLNDLKINENTAPKPTSYYGISKLSSEEILKKHFSSMPNVNLLILRPALVYGPNEDEAFYGPTGFIRKALNDEVIEVWGDGKELREFVFIDDLTRMLFELIKIKFGGTINIVNGQSFTFMDIINEIKFLKKSVDFKSRLRTREKVDQGYDNSLLNKLIPDYKKTNLSEAISKIYESEKQKKKKNDGM